MVAQPIASVIIPAHNEDSVIGRLISALTAGSAPLQIIVACNGCTDRTAAVARGFGPSRDVHVLEIPEASKSSALRAAECLDPTFPRMFVDADVVVTGQAVVAVAEALNRGPQVAGRPALSYDTKDSVPLVKAFYRARSRTPELMTSLWGAGFYGVSAQGRRRWGPFPDIGADDLFVNSLFDPNEVVVVDTEPVVVRTPRKVRPLLSTLRRVHSRRHRTAVGADVDAFPVEVAVRRTSITSSTSLHALVKANRSAPTQWLDLMVYVAISLAARSVVRLGSSARGWQRDNSSR